MLSGHLALIAGQLNAPFGTVVKPADIAQALREGSLDGLPVETWVKALIPYMFVELPPATIGRAALEAGVRLEEAWALYQHVRDNYHLPRVKKWEDALNGVL